MGACETDEILIVNATVVPHLTIGIQHKDFRGPFGLDRIGNHIAQILEHRKLDVVAVHKVPHLRQAILRIRIDAQKFNTLIREFLSHLRQARTVQFHERALGS